MRKPFEEIFEDQTRLGTKVQTDEYHESGTHIIIDQGLEQIAGYTDREEGVFSAVPAIIFGDHTRIIKYVDEPFFLGADGVKVLRCKLPDPNYRYLYYALKHSRIPNTGYNRHYKWLKEVQIPYPNAKHQEEIVAILDDICRAIAVRQRQLLTLDTLIKARFVEVFGDTMTNEKGWPRLTLNEACASIFGGGTPSKNHPEYFTGTIPWVSPKDMKSDVIRDSIDHITEDAIDNSSTNLVPVDSVLMVIRSGILKHSLPVAINRVPVTINQDMKAFIPGKLILSGYLMYYFKTIESDVLAGVRSVTADNIDFKAFQQRLILVPPMELQTAFTAFVSQVDKSKVAVQKSLNEAQLLFDSLMQKYFG